MRGLSVVLLTVSLSGCGGCVNDESTGKGTTGSSSNPSRPPNIFMTPNIARLANLADGAIAPSAPAAAPEAGGAAAPGAAPDGN